MHEFPEVELRDDVRPAAWLEIGLRPWERRRLVRVASLVPDGYRAYGRLLHRASRVPGEQPVRWSEIAASRGITLGAETRFNDVVGWEPSAAEQDPPWPWQRPESGSLTRDECAAVADVLGRYTSTPDRCWFAVWEGYGWTGFPAQGSGPPRVRLEHRDCLLFAGAVRAADAFRSGPWFQSPTLWWPDDRAWVVASELDIFSTYVAGSAECIAELVADARVEALACAPDDRIDSSPYPDRPAADGRDEP